MNSKELMDSALKLPPGERFALIDALMGSLDCPDAEINRQWMQEAQRRLDAYRAGQATGVPAQELLGDF